MYDDKIIVILPSINFTTLYMMDVTQSSNLKAQDHLEATTMAAVADENSYGHNMTMWEMERVEQVEQLQEEWAWVEWVQEERAQDARLLGRGARYRVGQHCYGRESRGVSACDCRIVALGGPR